MCSPKTVSVKLLSFLLIALFCCKYNYAQLTLKHYDINAHSILDVSMLDENNGYLVTEQALFKTTNKGVTLEPIRIDLENLELGLYDYLPLYKKLKFTQVKANSNVITVFGNYGNYAVILRSEDNGLNWIIAYAKPVYEKLVSTGILSVDFSSSNPLYGIASDPDKILMTTDGGKNWIPILDDMQSYYTNLKILNDSTLYAKKRAKFGNDIFKLIKVVRGKATVTAIDVSTQLNLYSGGVMYSEDNIYFLNSNLGYAFIRGYCYKVEDSGKKWTRLTRGVLNKIFPREIAFKTESIGYLIDNSNFIYRTDNGGINWEPVSSNFINRDKVLEKIKFEQNDLFAFGKRATLVSGLESNLHGLPKAQMDFDTTEFQLNGKIVFDNVSKANYSSNWLLNGQLQNNSFIIRHLQILPILFSL